MTALSCRMFRSGRVFFNCLYCMEYDILNKISYIVSVGMQTEMEAAYANI